jgi:hypothetical protein
VPRLQLPEQQSPLPTQCSPAAAHKQVEVAPATSLSVNTTAGNDPPTGQVGFRRVRLLLSAVKPSFTTEGVFDVPSSIAISTTMVVEPGGLKVARVEQQSPTTLNSAAFQPAARLTKGGFDLVYSLVAVDIVTVSVLPSVVPVRLSCAKSVISWMGTGTPLCPPSGSVLFMKHPGVPGTVGGGRESVPTYRGALCAAGGVV